MEERVSTIRSGQRTAPCGGHAQDEGEPAGLRCGAQVRPVHDTQTLSPMVEPAAYPLPPLGSAVRDGYRSMTLQIEGMTLSLPFHDDITIGRPISQFNPWQTHVDLSRFDAHERGVSRRHLRITSRGHGVYVSDLNSTNGTWLSGQRLTPFNEYLLHDGDELRLGLLKAIIRL